jgi:hypothetical protein
MTCRAAADRLVLPGRIVPRDGCPALALQLNSRHGPTVTVMLLLKIFPDWALIFTLPTATAVTTPELTVATCELLVFQVATSVILNTPLQVFAFAVKVVVLGWLETEIWVGDPVMVIDVIQPTVTVTVCEPISPARW